MGNFRIVIDAVGGHGTDRDVKDGETVNFYKDGNKTPDALAKFITESLKWTANCQINSATLIHWPGESTQVVDDLITGKRTGQF